MRDNINATVTFFDPRSTELPLARTTASDYIGSSESCIGDLFCTVRRASLWLDVGNVLPETRRRCVSVGSYRWML